MGKTKILEVEGLSASIGRSSVLSGLTFDVDKGSVLAIIGPNGAGKTVLLKSLLGLMPSTGTVRWAAGARLGYVPQRMDIETDVPLTIREFFGLRGGKLKEGELKEALDFVQCPEALLDSGLGAVSVGQRQRILVAWAVLGKPDVLLFDEPTADIDIAGQESIYNMLRHLRDERGMTIILVSHDINVVYKHADKVLCLNRTGLCIGSPREVLTPDQLLALYGGESAFFQHKHEH